MLVRRGVLLSVAVVTVAVVQPRLGPSSFSLGVAAAAQAGPARDLPLEPTRRLRFTTDEGTWMSLDVSPDGQTIVFDLLGDLYTVPIDGGQAGRITQGMAFDAQPRYSPDGRSIVFISDRNGSDNVWIANADGTNPRKLTSDERTFFISPEWSPDGDYVIVSKSTEIVARPQDFHLFLYHKDGGSGIQLTGADSSSEGPRSFEARAHLGATFGADSRFVYMSASAGGGYGSWQIAVLDRATGHLFQRTHEMASGLRPVVSPDGLYLVYATRRDNTTGLKLVELASGDERWLVPEVDRDDQDGFWTRDVMPGSAFTPDGSALIASYGGKFWRVSIPDGQAREIPFTADVDIGLGPLARFEYEIDDSVTARRIENVQMSPDGSRLAFSALGRLWTQNLPNGTPRRVTDSEVGEHFPVWSPDGRYLAYVTWDDLEGGDIFRVRADGRGRPERLTRQKAFYERLNYTPDGNRLVAARGSRHQRINFFDELRRGRPQSTELIWIPAEGGETSVITLLNYSTRWAPTHFGVPHFTDDGDRLFFTDSFEGLVSVRWDGTDRRVVAEIKGWEWTRNPHVMADEILMSPKGDRVLALVNHNVYLLDVPKGAAAFPTVFIPRSASSSVPVKRLSTIGADFIGWSADAEQVYWAVGSTLFVHDLAKSSDEGDEYHPERHDVVIHVARDTPSGSVVLRGARIITMRGDAVIENADLVVTNNRISAVGPRGTVTIPSGAREIDVSGKTILPGYVDIHAHMWTPWGVHRRQNWEYLANLAYGVTGTRDPQTMTADVVTYGDRVATGDIIGPRVFSTARGIFASQELGNMEDARNVLRRYGEFYRTETVKNYLNGDRKHRQRLVMAAREFQITPTAEGNRDFKMNLTLAIDGFAGQEHVYTRPAIYKDVVELIVQSGLTYTPTLIVSANGGPAAENWYYREHDVHSDVKLQRYIPHEELDRRTLRRNILAHPNQYTFAEHAAQAAKIVAAGGRVGLGAHGQLQGLGVHWELWSFAAGGMSPHNVLRVGTILSAEAIGHGKNFGSIEPGKFADLQVLDANPLDNIRNTTSIRYVMKNGRLYSAETMDEIWPRERKLERQWWWN